MNLSERVEDIQIRDTVYFSEAPPNTIKYSIVKYTPCDVYQTTLEDGQQMWNNEINYVLATLEWDFKEQDFNFVSIGDRWLKIAPSKNVCNMILNFWERKRKELMNE